MSCGAFSVHKSPTVQFCPHPLKAPQCNLSSNPWIKTVFCKNTLYHSSRISNALIVLLILHLRKKTFSVCQFTFHCCFFCSMNQVKKTNPDNQEAIHLIGHIAINPHRPAVLMVQLFLYRLCRATIQRENQRWLTILCFKISCACSKRGFFYHNKKASSRRVCCKATGPGT